MKEGARYIAIASGPINNRKKTLLVGIIFRNNYIEGLLSTSIDVDGTDSTSKTIKMIKSSRFAEQIRILLFNGIALAGLNIIDPKMLERELDAKVVLLTKRQQNPKELVGALSEFSRIRKIDVRKRIMTVKDYSSTKPVVVNGLFLQSSLDSRYVKRFAENAFESLRIAHIVASGISKGESKGHL